MSSPRSAVSPRSPRSARARRQTAAFSDAPSQSLSGTFVPSARIASAHGQVWRKLAVGDGAGPRSAEHDLAATRAVAAGRPLEVMLALGPDERDELFLEELVHHLQPDADREGEQTFAHRAGQVRERALNLARQAQPVELFSPRDPDALILVHAVLLLDWSRSPPALAAGGEGGSPLKFHRSRDNLISHEPIR